jgi:hypothetical protein
MSTNGNVQPIAYTADLRGAELQAYYAGVRITLGFSDGHVAYNKPIMASLEDAFQYAGEGGYGRVSVYDGRTGEHTIYNRYTREIVAYYAPTTPDLATVETELYGSFLPTDGHVEESAFLPTETRADGSHDLAWHRHDGSRCKRAETTFDCPENHRYGTTYSESK